METDIQYAIIKAAYLAWDNDEAQRVDGFPVVIIPDTVQAAIDRDFQTQGLRIDEAHFPKFWIEHEGRRAQIAWLVEPQRAPDERG